MAFPAAAAIGGAVVTALFEAIRRWGPEVIVRVLAAFGVGLFTYNVAVPSMLDFIKSYVSGLPPWVFAHFGALGIDVAITMILSALAARASAKVFLRRSPTE